MQQLVQGIRAVVAHRDVGIREIDQIKTVVRQALPRLQTSQILNIDLRPGRYLCYKDPDYEFVVMAMVWGAGDGTPVHDHGTWGVEAVLRSTLRVTNYTCCDENPEPLDELIISAGDIMHNIPPSRDVHKVEHHSGPTAVSLHIYGREMNGNRVFVPGKGFQPSRLETRDLCRIMDAHA